MRKIKSIYRKSPNELEQNASIIVVICILSFSLLVIAKLLYGQDQVDNSIQSAPQVISDKKDKPECPVLSCTSGEAFVDGSLRVFEGNYVKMVDLVEISTPVAPAANHARIFLRPDGSKQSLVVIFDDSTIFCFSVSEESRL